MSELPSGAEPDSDKEDLRERLLDTERRLAELLDGELLGGELSENGAPGHRGAEALDDQAIRLLDLGGWQLDAATGVVQCSAHASRVLGFDRAGAFSLRDVLRLFDRDWRSTLIDYLRACLHSGVPFRMECELWSDRAGQTLPTPIWCVLVGEPVKDEVGRVTAVRGAVQNLGRRHSAVSGPLVEPARKALMELATAVTGNVGPTFFQQLAGQMASALQADGCFIARIEEDEGVLSARCFAGVLDGIPAEELCYRLAGTPCQNLVDNDQFVLPDGAQQAFPRDPHLWDLGVDAYAGCRLCDSQGRPTGIMFVIYRHPMVDTVTVASTLKIFAARAASELERLDALAQLQEQASLLDRASDAIVVRDLEHRIRYWNRGAERLYGWSREEVLGQRVDRLCYEDYQDYSDAMQSLFKEGEWQGNLEQCHKSGRKLVVSAHWSLVTDDEGRPISVMAINTDITRRLALEEQLQQAQRLESIGQLTGGVAHDFNNLLTVILGNAELLEEALEHDPQLSALLGMVRSAAERGSDLTRRLLAFARRQTLAPETIDVNNMLRDMDGLLRRAVPAYIDIEMRRGRDVGAVVADPAQLESAVLNLVINARDAMGEGGRLRITTERVTLPAAGLDGEFPPVEGEYVVMTLCDNGCGMTPEVAVRAFDPFFSTKEKGKGTGLGLSMVYGFIKQSGGHVELASEPGVGTTIRLLLPGAGSGNGISAPRPRRELPRRGRGHILVVEDDELVRRFAEEQLRTLGYEVSSVGHGRDALALLERDPSVDLLFTDVVMPGMNGRQLAEQARVVRPGLKVLYTSGYTENVMAEEGRLDPGVRLLGKPYRGAELARQVSEALAGSDP